MIGPSPLDPSLPAYRHVAVDEPPDAPNPIRHQKGVDEGDGAGEAFFVPRDAPNRARAAGEEPARFVAVGAPKVDDDAVIFERCPACDEVTGRASHREGDEVVLTSAACSTETTRFGPGTAED